MRNEPNVRLDSYRRVHPTLGESKTGSSFGYFEMGELRIVSSGQSWADNAWEHVSVTRRDGRTPSWEEMCRVKKLFWRDDECVVQYHPKKTAYVNIHKGCLHLWSRPEGFPMPDVSQV